MFVATIKDCPTCLTVAVFTKLFFNVDDSKFNKAGSCQRVMCDIIKSIKQQGIGVRRRWRFRFRCSLSGLVLQRLQSQNQRFCSGSELMAMNLSLLEPLLTSGTEQIPAEWLSYHSDFYFPLAHALLLPLKPSIF